MKTNLKISIFILTILVVSCKKDKLIIHINCDGLLTDTIGNSDSAIIFIPSAFTPNGDHLNESFGPETENITSYVMTIYNEDNQMVFVSDEQTKRWRPQTNNGSSEKFYYKLQATTRKNRNLGRCGEVYLLMCLPDGLSINSLRFPDQMVPKYGFVLPTQETLSACL